MLAGSLALFLFALPSGPGVDFVLLISLALVRFRAWATCDGTGEGDQIEDFGQRRLDDDDDNDGERDTGFATLAGLKKRRDDIESKVSVAECASCWQGSESTWLSHDSRALKSFESFSKRL